ncbi:hypothetical protein ABBQ38_000167 [Trebouxia sp. C0009 RCD-2024]
MSTCANAHIEVASHAAQTEVASQAAGQPPVVVTMPPGPHAELPSTNSSTNSSRGCSRGASLPTSATGKASESATSRKRSAMDQGRLTGGRVANNTPKSPWPPMSAGGGVLMTKGVRDRDNEELERTTAASSSLLTEAHAANQKLQDQLATALQMEAMPGMLSNSASSPVWPWSHARSPSSAEDLSSHPQAQDENAQLASTPPSQLLVGRRVTHTRSFLSTPFPVDVQVMLAGMPSVTPTSGPFSPLTRSAQANHQERKVAANAIQLVTPAAMGHNEHRGLLCLRLCLKSLPFGQKHSSAIRDMHCCVCGHYATRRDTARSLVPRRTRSRQRQDASADAICTGLHSI